MEKQVVKINEKRLRRMITEGIEKALGYDMSTPVSWDDCYEHMKRAFIAGVEYGRNNE